MADQQKDECSEPLRITLRVVGQDTPERQFRLKMDTELEKLKIAYSKLLFSPVAAFRFIFDGKRILDDMTPEELEMQDGDIIEVYEEQKGGKI